VRISAVDPANLTGIVLPGPRVPAQPDRWVEYLDGLPVEPEAPPLRKIRAAG
jgi:ATP-dependent Lhr-like helicase